MLHSTIRNGIGTIRIAEHLNARLLASGLPARKTNLNIVIDTGKQCTYLGTGECFESFKRTGLLSEFTGFGQKPAISTEDHYSEAPLRFMTFADTYGNDKYKQSTKLNSSVKNYGCLDICFYLLSFVFAIFSSVYSRCFVLTRRRWSSAHCSACKM